MIRKHLTVIFLCMFWFVGCATIQENSKFSKQDRSNYPKVSADADRVVTLITNKDNTRFSVNGSSIGNSVAAGSELKILLNGKMDHTIIAEAPGYKPKPLYIQPPYDERSPISFSFIYTDKLLNNDITPVKTTPISEQKESENISIERPPPLLISPTNISSIDLSKNKHERRIALVIGNSAYRYTAKLTNPINDAEDIAKILTRLNFKVILRTNADLETMADAIFEFGQNLQGGGIGLFYYAGHGVQVKGENYLLPVDANLLREDEVKRKAISANDVLEKMGEGKSHLNLVFLDACRNNPFPSTSRSISRGLTTMYAPNGTLLVFSTNPDNVALDGSGRNGTYTKHLLQHLDHPGLEIGMMLRKVRTAVKEETGGKQVPWENGSIEGEFYFNNK